MSVQSTRKQSETTPPDSFSKPPLTPPPSEQKSGTLTEHILREIERCKSGRRSSTAPWLRYKVSPADFKILEPHLQINGIADDKLRSDYFPSANLFVLRMPSLLHEAIILSIVDDIKQQLNLISKGAGSAAAFARSIRHTGSATIRFDDPNFGRHDPDISFRPRGAIFPSLICEISYSQKKKDIPRLVDDYILGSNGNICVVIGVDIGYRDKSATLSIWRPHLQVNEAGEKELVAHQTFTHQFRTANGETNLEAGLLLHLEDFAPQGLLPEHTVFDKDLSIASTDLCAYLHAAEQDESNEKQRIGFAAALEPDVKRKRRSTSSIEQLNTDDESYFQAEEEQAAKRSREDTDYVDS